MNTPRPASYREAHSALNGGLAASAVAAPVAEIICVVVGVAANLPWFLVFTGPLFLPVLIYGGLLYRNWPTGIRIDGSAISIGAIGSDQAARRRPTVNHQSWGLYTCPWQAVEGVRVVTGRAELRYLKNSPRYYTFTNRWGGTRGRDHCNIGVLASPFMRAALVIDVDLLAVMATETRPARYFSNFKDGNFSRLIRPQLSPTWVVPTRHPEALSAALQRVSGDRGCWQGRGLT